MCECSSRWWVAVNGIDRRHPENSSRYFDGGATMLAMTIRRKGR